MTDPPAVVAAFDVDGTLTHRDCVRPFLERFGGRRALLAAVARRPVVSIKALARRDRDRLKEVVVGGVLAGRDVAEVDAVGHEFADWVHATLLRPDTLGRLRWHQAQGHSVVLVSASLRPYLEPLGRRLGVEAVLCTDGLITDGRYAAALAGQNCRAGEKAVRLTAWLHERGIWSAQVWAYGDSRGDRELLALAHRPVWVAGTTVPSVPVEDES